MCGVAGFYAFRRDEGDNFELLQRMIACQRHRGPIESGFHRTENVALGMARLSIIDIEGGHQPIYNEDGSLAIVFNGQIYNYIELMEALKAKGHIFKTRSDTEVLIHLYEEEGPQMLQRLNGMFAFAIHDKRRNSLFIARDRLGVKPLYYAADARRVLFASEIKALLEDSSLDRSLSSEAFAEYLTLMYVRSPHTPFKKIFKLRPGHYLDIQQSGVTEIRWWKPEPEDSTGLSYGATCEKLRALLEDAVRLRLRSDVPVGSLLSGGLDSSAITAIAARQLEQPLHTFTIGYSDSEFDELPYAAAVAKAYRTNHHVQNVQMEDSAEFLPRLIWHLDEPNADSAIIPTYMISKLAASKLRVVLSGVGGDELFGGYPRYFEGRRIEHFYRRLPSDLRKQVLGPLLGKFGNTLRYRAEMNNLPQPDRFLWQSSCFAPEMAALMAGNPMSVVNFVEEYADTDWADPANRLMLIDLKSYLSDDVLHLTDRMSMASSLEIREPLLDHRLVSFALGLPSSFKINQRGRVWKRCLKDAVAPLLPPEILSRPKWGFGSPVTKWMRSGMEAVVRQLYANSSAVREGILNERVVRKYFDETAPYDSLRRGGRLWSLLILELWVRIFVDGKGRMPSMTLHEMADCVPQRNTFELSS